MAKLKSDKNYILGILILFFAVHCLLLSAYADDNPLNSMRDDALSYFKPLKGRVISVKDSSVVADIGAKSQVRRGMRFTVFREGTPFLHPVTKETIGVLESAVGKVEVKEASEDTSILTVIKGNIRESDKIRISETGVRMLFYHGKDVDWNLADSYYRILKETARLELIDTALETDNEAEIIKEANRLNADVALILYARESAGDTALKQRLIWVDGATGFAESESKVAVAFMKELKFGEEFFGPQKSDAKLHVKLPFIAKLIASADIDADGKAELLISTDNDVRVYMSSGELSNTYHIKGALADNNIYLDAMDVNGDGRDEVIITTMKSSAVISRIYELKDTRFSVLWEGNIFLRRIGKELIAQAYDRGEGYSGRVYTIVWNNGYKKGNDVNLPKDVNIYDFVYINESGKRLVFAYDDAGYLNLYDEGAKIWKSKEEYGGFPTTFKRTSPTVMVDKGEWSVKDRIFVLDREVFVLKRTPLVGMAKGLGYGKSQIKSLWWTGISMEERDVIENMSGNSIDYAVAGDKLIVLSRPAFGIKLENILKGENPLVSELYIYSLKGR